MSIDAHWADPFRLEDQLTEEERQIHDEARRFAQERLQPLIRDWHDREVFDPAIMREFGEMGFLGAVLEGYGCAGISSVSYGLVCRELEYVDTTFRSAVGVQTGLVMAPIHRFGSPEQRERWLPDLASGKIIGAFGLTEPDHGSDPSNMGTRARKVAGGWRVSGTKTWITLAPIADLLVIWARDDDGTIGGFIVRNPSDGLAVQKIENKYAMRASPTGMILMDEVFVPEDHRLADTRGLTSALSALSNARFGICWGTMGAAEACWHASRNYVLERRQFGHALAGFQLIQRKLADMQTEIVLGLQAALRISRMRDEGSIRHEAISLVKRNNAGKALEIARMARDMHGGNGISSEFGVIRHMLNLEVVNTLEGTHDIHALVLGRAQTGISAFSAGGDGG